MKTVRILLLVLFAVLLPFRGAVAQLVHCADESGGSKVELRLHEHSHSGPHAAAGEHIHHHDSTGHHEHDSGVPDECSFCTASCSTSPLLGTVPPLLTPATFTAVVFPSFDAPAPSFLSDGQERPPRSV